MFTYKYIYMGQFSDRNIEKPEDQNGSCASRILCLGKNSSVNYVDIISTHPRFSKLCSDDALSKDEYKYSKIVLTERTMVNYWVTFSKQ